MAVLVELKGGGQNLDIIFIELGKQSKVIIMTAHIMLRHS